jgi:hypothetical protein
VRKIWGIKWGYRGFYEDFPKNWMELTPQIVENIHNLGALYWGPAGAGSKPRK